MDRVIYQKYVIVFCDSWDFFCQVWMPDTFFRNEKDAKFHDIIQPNLYVRVFPNGDVLYSIRVKKEKKIKNKID